MTTNKNSIPPANRFVYWVAYHFCTKPDWQLATRNGFGGVRVNSDAAATSLAWMEATREWIKAQNPEYVEVLIVNVMRLPADERWEENDR